MADKMNIDERAAIARAIWALMREHEDRCDEELEDLEPSHPIWAYADAALAASAVSDGVASLSAAEPAVAVPSVGWPDWCPEAFSALVMLDRMDVGPDDDARVDAVSAIVCSMAEKLRPSTAPALTQGAASPEGAVYAEMPQLCVLHRDLHTGDLITGYDEDDLRDFADRTHAIRIASHGQAPAQRWNPLEGGNPETALQMAAVIAHRDAQQAPAGAALRSMIEGMSVSVDVSTGDHDAGHRYFGTVTEVMECKGDKHGVTLLVQDAEPNFAAPAAPSTPEAGGWMPIETAPKDGTTVLVYPPTWPGRACSTAHYNADRYSNKPRPYWERDDSHGKVSVSREVLTTHWREMPASPTIEGESK